MAVLIEGNYRIIVEFCESVILQNSIVFHEIFRKEFNFLMAGLVASLVRKHSHWTEFFLSVTELVVGV